MPDRGGDDTVSPITVVTSGPLDAELTTQVFALVERAIDTDGVSPLSEHVMLHLRHGGDAPVRNLVAYLDDKASGDEQVLAGYAHLDVTDRVEGPSAELVVDPRYRKHGVGHALAKAVLAESPNGRLRLWSHGGHPAAARLAASLGLTRTRNLWQMRRSLRRALPSYEVPDGVTLRTFVPGQDDDAWVTLNNAAFRDHPEQGGWTVTDLHRRMAEPWFDAQGFFLCERDGRLVGFHWTKVHGNDHTYLPHSHDGSGPHGHEPIGEVYVVGVAPTEQGYGLGRVLTLVGLHYLRGLGLSDVMLYVDAENVAAIQLYERLGFARWDTDVMYASG